MAKAYSLDLRRKVFAAWQQGEESQAAVGARFRVSESFVGDLAALHRQTGDVAARPRGGGRKSLATPAVLEHLGGLVRAHDDHTIAEHRANGDRILIISASGTHLVKPIAARIGVEDVLGIELQVTHGVYSGLTEGVLTYREGKVTRLKQWLHDEGETLEGASFYSDSRNDLPLLLQVAYPHVINPDPALLAHAEQAGWPIHRWS